MKYMKMLGLAAIAAMALTAFVASSASATTLHGVNGAVLKTGSTISSSLKSGGSAILTNTKGETLDTCKEGSVTGTTSNETGETVTGSVATSGLTWGGCINTTETTEGGTLHIAFSSGNNGTVTGSGFKVTVLTPFIGATCNYTLGGGVKLGELVGGTPATLVIKGAVVEGASTNGFLCPKSAVWNAEYTVTNPTTLTVSN